MPEIPEVARIVHYIRKHLVGKTLATVQAKDDNNVFGKAGTTAVDFEKAMTGKKITGAGQQGKYFWMEMSSPPHPLMHFGMTGWLKINTDETGYYREKKEDGDWPPKFWKFIMKTKEEPKTEAAFVDSRRFGRVRLVDCAAGEIRKVSPLKENGPDPVVDKDMVTLEWLVEKLKSKKLPIKALLLDQANISGIGNWVGDEIMYHAKIHPEQYSNTLTDAQMKQLHTSIHYVCNTAVDLLGDSDQFPEHWLFKHRWSKGKKDKPAQLPNGDKIVFLTIGGRTSAVVPSLQKKTGPVAMDAGKDDLDESDGAEVDKKVAEEHDVKRKGQGKEKANTSAKRKTSKTEHEGDALKKSESKTGRGKKGTEPPVNNKAPGKKRKAEGPTESNTQSKKAQGAEAALSSKRSRKSEAAEDTSGRRRSTRIRG